MNTGKSGKRKGGQYHIHTVGTSSVASLSTDHRRTRLRTDNVGETSNTPTTASQASEDLRTLQAVDDIASFSYMLGEDLPIFPDEIDYPGVNDDTIRVTLKDKRNENSVRRMVWLTCTAIFLTHTECRTFPSPHGFRFVTNTWTKCCASRVVENSGYTNSAVYVGMSRCVRSTAVRSRIVVGED